MERSKLHTWKRIAAHLGCSVRTAQRYESMGMPVHHVGRLALKSVFAFDDEIARWLENGPLRGAVDAAGTADRSGTATRAAGSQPTPSQGGGETCAADESYRDITAPGGTLGAHPRQIVAAEAPDERAGQKRRMLRLEVLRGADSGALFTATAGSVSVGREADNGIAHSDPGVSRHHATIYVQDGGIRIEDFRSKNGTFVNGRRVDGWAEISPGDEIRLGKTLDLVIRDAGAEETTE